MSRDERGSGLNRVPSTQHLQLASHQKVSTFKTCLCFSSGFFLSISALLSPNQDEKSPERHQRRQFALHQEQRKEENQNVPSNQINQSPIFIFCDAPVSFLLSE